MIRKFSPIVLLLLLLPLLQVSTVFGEIIDFDDLDPVWSDNRSILDGYAGFNWVNFMAMYPEHYYNEQYMSGYLVGMVSPHFIAWNRDEMAAEFRSDTPFNFISVYLTAAWQDLEITVEGFYGSQLLYSNTVNVYPDFPLLFDFNYFGIDRVRFTSISSTAIYSSYSSYGSGTFFVLDNLEIDINETNNESGIEIDIKPGSPENPINPKSRGLIPVAILSSEEFNAPASIDPGTLTFGASGDEESLVKCSVEDVNNDGWTDMICHFKTQVADFICGYEEGILRGNTFIGEPIVARDTIRTVPCNK